MPSNTDILRFSVTIDVRKMWVIFIAKYLLCSNTQVLQCTFSKDAGVLLKYVPYGRFSNSHIVIASIKTKNALVWKLKENCLFLDWKNHFFIPQLDSLSYLLFATKTL